jgi:hypothetical protein
VQKGKIDLESALLAMDKLLRANELNFALLTLIPAAILAYSLASLLVRAMFGDSGEKQKKQFAEALRQVEKLCNLAENSDASRGRMLIALYRLSLWTDKMSLDADTRPAILEDLGELARPDLTDDQRRWTLVRMHSFCAV